MRYTQQINLKESQGCGGGSVCVSQPRHHGFESHRCHHNSPSYDTSTGWFAAGRLENDMKSYQNLLHNQTEINTI